MKQGLGFKGFNSILFDFDSFPFFNVLFNDVFELSAEGFDGTPAADASVSVDSTTYKVEVQ